MHRSAKSNPPVSTPVLDLSGKYSRKRPPLQRWQAFSAIYYRPKGSPLRDEVKSLYKRRGDPAAIEFLVDFLPPKADVEKLEYLNFLSAYLRERCTHLSNDEEQAVEAYIKEEALSAMEIRDRPWLFDDNFEDEPLLAENKYIQE